MYLTTGILKLRICVIVFSTAILDYEVACLDISPLDENVTRSELVAVGLWKEVCCTCYLNLTNNEPFFKFAEIIPRSILMACFEGIVYLLCALGDASMFYFVLDKHMNRLTD